MVSFFKTVWKVVKWFMALFSDKTINICSDIKVDTSQSKNLIYSGDKSINVNGSKNSISMYSIEAMIINVESRPLQEIVNKALVDVGNWCYCYGTNGYGQNEFYFCNENFDDVRFVEKVSADQEVFHESWVPSGQLCDKSLKSTFILRYKGQDWPSYSVVSVWVDGGRSLIVAPNKWHNCDEGSVEWHSSFYYVKGSIGYLLNQIFLAKYSQDSVWSFRFSVFESEELAEKGFVEDVKKTNHEHRYYIERKGSRS